MYHSPAEATEHQDSKEYMWFSHCCTTPDGAAATASSVYLAEISSHTDAWSSGSRAGHSVYTGLICAC